MSADGQPACVDQLEAASIRLVSISFPGRSSEWNDAIDNAFTQGAAAVLTVAQGTLLESAASSVILEAMTRHPRAILLGVIVDAQRPYHVQHAGYWWSDAELQWRCEAYMEIIPDPTAQSICPIDLPSAAGLLIPRPVWDVTGGFDERFDSFLADLDFCLRARERGFPSLQLRDARFSTARTPESFDRVPEPERLKSTLLLARQHSIPSGLIAMTLRQLLIKIREELDRVDFWADYGANISLTQRTLWFLRNGVQALRRERLRLAVAETLRLAMAAARHPGPTVAT
jgi:hypothetical protein